MIEAGPQILPGYPLDLSLKAKEELEKRNIKVLTNFRVSQVTEKGVYSDTECIESKNIMWAAGNQASPLLESLQVSLDKQGRVLVDADSSIPDYPNVFVLGDAACVMKDGHSLPALDPVALQQGRYIAKNIAYEIPKSLRKAYVYLDKGSLATIGMWSAVGVMKNVKLKGFTAWFAWCFVHLIYLTGFSNRLLVIFKWVCWYVFGARSSRILHDPLDKLESR